MPPDAEPLCVLIDARRPVPFRQGGEETAIHSVQQLVDGLRALAARGSGMAIVSVPGGPQLFVGLGGQVAGVRVYPERSSGRSWSATPATPHTSDDLWVPSEGEPSQFEAAGVIPVDDAIGIAAHVIEHGELPGTVEWVNLRGERLTTTRLGRPRTGGPG